MARPYLLRAHPLLVDDIVSGPAFGRTLLHLTAESTRWFSTPRLVRLGIAAFADVAGASNRLEGNETMTHVDAGAGIRCVFPVRETARARGLCAWRARRPADSVSASSRIGSERASLPCRFDHHVDGEEQERVGHGRPPEGQAPFAPLETGRGARPVHRPMSRWRPLRLRRRDKAGDDDRRSVVVGITPRRRSDWLMLASHNHQIATVQPAASQCSDFPNTRTDEGSEKSVMKRRRASASGTVSGTNGSEPLA